MIIKESKLRMIIRKIIFESVEEFKTLPSSLKVYHISSNENLQFDDIDFSGRQGSRQGRNGRISCGFYTSENPDVYLNRSSYGTHIYSLEILPNQKYRDTSGKFLSTARISPEQRAEFISDNIYLLKGNDLVPEWVILDRQAIDPGSFKKEDNHENNKIKN